MPTVLVTGASRGLGLEFVRQYGADGWRVIAGCRHPQAASGLSGLAQASGGRISVHALDVADHTQIERLSHELAATPIDLLVNNAGIAGHRRGAAQRPTVQRFGQSDYDEWLNAFRVNALAPMKMAEAFLRQVAASELKCIATLTSVMGSIGRNTLGGMYAYRSTKAAANAIVRSLALDLARHGIIAVALHPGWVRTDMGGPRAELDAGVSVAGLRKVVAGLTREQSGKFLAYDGNELPW
jgi:NAD(P)-dependent dehydrogenase (short-subunit alcohol dehydrogenase family)